MKERPILFSALMVRAILDGRKTQTRRIVDPQPAALCRYEMNDAGTHALHLGPPLHPGETMSFVPSTPRSRDHRLPCPYGVPGDRLWVRETWGLHAHGDETDWFRGSVRGVPADSLQAQYHLALRADWGPLQEGCLWRPAIFMPRWASRITLEVTEVRVQLLQEIAEEQARAEGVERSAPVCGGSHARLSCEREECHAGLTFRLAFADLWDSINGKRAPWASNPWCWAITFRRVP